MKKYIVFIITLFIGMQFSYAAVFCVTTSTGLQNALDSASSNNQHNVILIAEGSYVTPGSEFDYNSGWDLEISGGWSEFFNNPCGQQLSGNPLLTVLDGNSSNRVMKLKVSGTADITVSNLAFINGSIGEFLRGGGLDIRSSQNNHTGNLVLERNAFINNEADWASALSISGFNKMIIRNNLFAVNNVITGNTIELLQNYGIGIYFTNNTVVSNTKTMTNNSGANLDISVSGGPNAAVYNNIFWGNDNRDLNLRGNGNHYLHNNDIGIRTGVTPFSDLNNFSSPPDFESGILNYKPSLNSPLVNAGKNAPFAVPNPPPFDQTWSLGSLDIIGNNRKQGSKVDIGAYETSPEVPIFENGFESD